MSARLAFFGNERLATGVDSQPAILKSLLAHGYEFAAVFVRGGGKDMGGIESFCRQAGLNVLSPGSKAELEEMVAAHPADAGILAAFGMIVPESVIGAYRCGIVNIHPSLLPAYRGPTPIEQAILDGAPETGVSLMALAPEMDAGPVYAQRHYRVPAGTTKAELAAHLQQLGASLLADSLPAITQGSLHPSPQNDKLATYTKLITKADGRIDWKLPAGQIERQVRAYAGWPGSRAELFGQDAIVTQVAVGRDNTDHEAGSIVGTRDGVIVIAAGDGSTLLIERLKPAGKKEMAAADFLRGLHI